MLFPGFYGVLTGLLTLGLTWLIVLVKTPKYPAFEFDAKGEKGAFEKILSYYLDLMKFILGLASGSIVLLVGSSALSSAGHGHVPMSFISPLILFALCVLYGTVFMVFLIFNYEAYRHHSDSGPYTRFKYTRNQALGFSSLICFCVGYLWLIFSVTA